MKTIKPEKALPLLLFAALCALPAVCGCGVQRRETARFAPVGPGEATNQIRDNRTGLIWARDAGNACGAAEAAMKWEEALSNCNSLTYGGAGDWRLPDFREMRSLIDNDYSRPALCNASGNAQWRENDPFRGVATGRYWTSTSYDDSPAGNAWAWFVSIENGYVNNDAKTGARYFAWPVRGVMRAQRSP